MLTTLFWLFLAVVLYTYVGYAGVVWAWLGPPKARTALPALEYLGIPESHVMAGKRLQSCNWMQSMDGDFDTGNVRYKSRERYSFGWSDPLGMFGSPGAS